METVRAYIACLLDLNATRRAADIAKSLRRNAKAKGWEVAFVPPPALHVTLRWLGDVDLGLVSPLVDALGAVAQAHPPFRAHVSGLVAGPDPAAPRQLALGFAHGAELLSALAADLDARLDALGLPPAPHAFRPQVTLARVLRAPTPLAELAPGGADAGPSAMHELVLYRCESPRTDVEPVSLARFALCPQPRGPSGAAEKRQ